MVVLEDMYIIFTIAFCILVFPVVWFCLKRLKEKVEGWNSESRRRREAAQQENVWNISSRVNNYQTAPNANHPWPTHDAHVSLEAIITDPMKDMRPGYNDPPPSYEQAVGSTGPRVDGASSNATAETSSAAADAPSSTAHAPAPGPGVVTAAVVTTAVVRVES